MFISFLGYKTYYEVYGKDSDSAPVIFLHGGPGSTCDSFRSLTKYVDITGRKWILYDQLGCGNSSSDLPIYLYSSKTWIEELENLIKKLQLEEYYLLGHSWGGMLAILYTLKSEHVGLKGLILSSTLSSAKLWYEEGQRLMSYLSEEDQKALSSFNNQSLEYQIAQLHYYQRYVSSNKKTSNEYISQQLSSHNLSYQIAWGNDEFTPTGELKDYEVTDQLKQIKVPTLILSGTDDESTPLINKTIYDNLGGYKEWILTPNSNHSSFINNQKYVEQINKFIRKVDKNEI